MTVEWKDICERCLTVHEAMPDGSPATCPTCQARVEMLALLGRYASMSPYQRVIHRFFDRPREPRRVGRPLAGS
jgi:hypothetical protein